MDAHIGAIDLFFRNQRRVGDEAGRVFRPHVAIIVRALRTKQVRGARVLDEGVGGSAHGSRKEGYNALTGVVLEKGLRPGSESADRSTHAITNEYDFSDRNACSGVQLNAGALIYTRRDATAQRVDRVEPVP